QTLYRDPGQAATASPARLPEGLTSFAAEGLQRLLGERDALGLALGEVMTEPKPHTWFDEPVGGWSPAALWLDRRTGMMYDEGHVFFNGEGLRAGGAGARLMRRLADRRQLSAREVQGASADAQAVLRDWFDAGWLRQHTDSDGD